jgi:hypothetical protein
MHFWWGKALDPMQRFRAKHDGKMRLPSQHLRFNQTDQPFKD